MCILLLHRRHSPEHAYRFDSNYLTIVDLLEQILSQLGQPSELHPITHSIMFAHNFSHFGRAIILVGSRLFDSQDKFRMAFCRACLQKHIHIMLPIEKIGKGDICLKHKLISYNDTCLKDEVCSPFQKKKDEVCFVVAGKDIPHPNSQCNDDSR
jgi:hypothetical protein